MSLTVSAQLSGLAYDNPEHFPIHAVFLNSDVTGAQAYTWPDTNGYYFVVFRGSSDIKDFIADIDIRRVKFLGTKVHSGFYTQYASIAPELKKLVKRSNTHTIVCTGHSLGGALATLAAVDLSLDGRKVICHTFGSPRVGNDKFAELFSKRVYTSMRVFNKRDPVTMVPLSFRFTHVDTGYSINSKQMIKPISGDLPWYKRIWYIIKHHDADFSFHACTLYRDCVNNNLLT